MRKLTKMNSAKNCLRPAALWLGAAMWTAWLCPNAYSQVGKERAGLAASKTGFHGFSKFPQKDSLMAFMHARSVKRMPPYRHTYSLLLLKFSKNRLDSLISVALLQDRFTLGAGNPNLLPPAGKINP